VSLSSASHVLHTRDLSDQSAETSLTWICFFSPDTRLKLRSSSGPSRAERPGNSSRERRGGRGWQRARGGGRGGPRPGSGKARERRSLSPSVRVRLCVRVPPRPPPPPPLGFPPLSLEQQRSSSASPRSQCGNTAAEQRSSGAPWRRKGARAACRPARTTPPTTPGRTAARAPRPGPGSPWTLVEFSARADRDKRKHAVCVCV